MKTVIFLFICVVSAHLSAASHYNMEVETIHSPDSRACTFFRLSGITEADPIVPNNGWFAVPLSHQGHDVALSLLLTAMATGRSVNVATTGASVCGHAEVSNIHFHY